MFKFFLPNFRMVFILGTACEFSISLVIDVYPSLQILF